MINVEFEKENAAESLSNEVQLVPSEISWEDFELMVGRFADVVFCCVMQDPSKAPSTPSTHRSYSINHASARN